ncbi:MAG: sulfurtransferase TusA family protein [Desulfobacteraceae bacterium]
MEKGYQTNRLLDVRGWRCPWVLLKAKSLLKQMKPGEILEVLSTDPEVGENFRAVLKTGGDRIVWIERVSGYFRLFIQRESPGRTDAAAGKRGGG